jgi:hypothetical protein
MEDPRLSEACEWLIANPSESISATSRLFKVPRTTLSSAMARTHAHARGGQNKILTTTQIQGLKNWIIHQYEQGLGAIKHMTYAVVCHLRKPKAPPSQSWLTKFMRTELQDFHIIKTKLIAQQRSTSQSESVVTEWFYNYQQFLLAHNIEPASIWNMDETGFQIGIPGGEEVIVPRTITELYTPSPDNRTLITIIEAVSASGKVTPPVLIMPAKVHMNSW